MAQIPTAAELGRRRQIETNGTIATVDNAGAVGAALAQFGGVVSDLGAAVQKEKDQLEDFDTRKRFQEWADGFEEGYVRSQDAAEPSGKGFTEGTVGSYDKSASKFLSDVPARLRSQYEAVIAAKRGDYRIGATKFELGRRRGYYLDESARAAERAAASVVSDPDGFKDYQAGVDSFVDTSGLGAADRLEAKRKAADILAKARLAGLVKAGRDDEARSVAREYQSGGSLVDRIIRSESGGKADARNPASSATGTGQFIAGTWLDLVKRTRPDLAEGKTDAEILAMRKDPGISREMISRYALENGAALRRAGIEVSEPALYAAHHFGAGGAAKLYKADPGASVESVLGSDVVRSNPVLAGKTVAETRQWIASRIGASDGGPSPFIGDRPASDFVEAAIERRETARKQDNAEINKARYNDLMVGILDGTKGEADVRAAREEGWLTDYEDIKRATKALDDDGAISLGKAAAKLADPTSLWDPTNADDRKAADLLFKADDGQQHLAAGDQAFVQSSLIPFIQRTGMIPSGARGALVAGMRSSDGAQVISSFAIMDQMERANPQAFAKAMGDDIGDKLDLYRTKLAYYSPEEIVAELRKSNDPAEIKARKALVAEGRKLAAGIDDGDIVDHFDIPLDFRLPDAPVDPLSNKMMRVEFDDLYADAYALTGDEDAAKDIALKKLERTWGTTDLGAGAGRLMRNPPEKAAAYPAIDGSHEWMRPQLDEVIRKYRPDLSEGDALLIADQQTEAEMRAGAPSYGILVKDAGGVWVPLTNDKNLPVGIRFDPSAAKAKKVEEFRKEDAFQKTLEDRVKEGERRMILGPEDLGMPR